MPFEVRRTCLERTNPNRYGTPSSTSAIHIRCAWYALGSALLGLTLVLLLISPRFAYEASIVHSPVLWVVGICLAAGVLYLSLLALLPIARPDTRALIWMLAVGIGMRLLMLPSIPIMDDDYHRYLWDGAMVASGFNPYAWAPAHVATQPAGSAIRKTVSASGLIAERVNHPNLRTIYPPIAQAGFALAHWLKPWSLHAWRSLLFAADAVTLVLLFALLRVLGRAPLWAALYWWNPLVVKELFNSAHMDALLLPLLLGVLLLAVTRRAARASATLALAVGV